MQQVKHIKKLKHAQILNRKFAVFLANSTEAAFTKKKKTATKQTTPNAQKHCILFVYMNETQFYTGNFILSILFSFHYVKYPEIRNFLCFFYSCIIFYSRQLNTVIVCKNKRESCVFYVYFKINKVLIHEKVLRSREKKAKMC